MIALTMIARGTVQPFGDASTEEINIKTLDGLQMTRVVYVVVAMALRAVIHLVGPVVPVVPVAELVVVLAQIMRSAGTVQRGCQ